MSIIARWIVLVAVAAALFVANPRCAYACSCLPPGPPRDALATSDAVFAGKVVKLSAPLGDAVNSVDPVSVTFEVSQSWKGAPAQTVVVKTASSSASCGFNFEQGREYLVYAETADGELQAGLCSRTQALATAAEDLAALGTGQAPATGAATGGSQTPSQLPDTGAEQPDLTLAWYMLAATGVVGLGAGLMVRARRRAGRLG